MTSAQNPSLNLYPRYFISYSRSDTPLSTEIFERVNTSGKNTWFDRETLAAGDKWLEELRQGIESCDEIILIASPSALKSKFVALEIRHAMNAQRTIRPIVHENAKDHLPPELAQFHFEIYRGKADLLPALERVLGIENGDSERAIKTRLTRSVYPDFSAGITDIAHSTALKLCLRLEPHTPEPSPIRLNLGLLLCRAGQWKSGLSHIQRYAKSTQSFPGWYFLALHLPRQRPCSSMSRADCVQVLQAVDMMRSSGSHSLGTILELIVRVGAQNLGQPTIEKLLSEWQSVIETTAEHPHEYQRFYWALKASFDSLPPALSSGLKQYLISSGT